MLDGYTLNPGDIPWTPVESVGELVVYDRTQPEDVFERIQDAEIVLTNKAVMGRELLSQLNALKFVSVMATGYNVVDIEAAAEFGIPVSNVPEYSTDAVAQHVFAALLSFIHRISEHDRSVREGDWCRCEDFSYWKSDLFELSGKTMGIVGLGKIGRATAALAHAFGMRVLAATRTERDPLPYPGFGWRNINELFAEADVVSLHCPQTSENVGFVDEELLGKMKPTGILVNTGRGMLVNEADLANALNERKIRGACIDVVSQEPMNPENPLLNAINCQITPHIAWAALEARQRLMATTAKNIEAFLKGQPINVVNGITS